MSRSTSDFNEASEWRGRRTVQRMWVLGKQTIEVDSSLAVVTFISGHTGLPQRGFLLYFEGELHISGIYGPPTEGISSLGQNHLILVGT